MSDGTAITAFEHEDGSGSQTVRFPGRFEREMSWDAPSNLDRLSLYLIHDRTPDGAEFTYERAVDQVTDMEQYEEGEARLPDGRTVGFTHHRDVDWDTLTVTPQDGSQFGARVALGSATHGWDWPDFYRGATGTLRSRGGREHSFTLRGDEGWNDWEFTANDETAGRFTLDDQFAGSGDITRRGEVVGRLTWDAKGEGVFEPVEGATITAQVPAAVLDFHVDRWIRNIASMGPSPEW
jgi:hypothetical protein